MVSVGEICFPSKRANRSCIGEIQKETHSWKTSKELEKAIQVYQNAKDRLPPRVPTRSLLENVDVSGQIPESFLSSYPLLETFHVSHSKHLTHINVRGSSLRLKHLHISFCKCIKSIEVYAPNLVSFEYRGLECVHIDLKYVPQLCDVSYAGRWESRRVFELRQSIPRCLATSQLVNPLQRIPFLPFVMS
ncbi:hypothetical protein V6N12_035152 [Hibiscus sabdariffa]|uniref:At1g61320/AtMIF1 LRR domain-containing protein n=1 Tax=Hibiscus sabdariffa TaxID=183260 RepID=A0ABR2AK94_9ROSI